MPGRYTLEVSSPGLERPLRTPAHFLRELNKVVSVRLHHAIDGRRRLQGVLLRADDRAIVVCLDDTGTEMSVAHSDIERARTVFVWGNGADAAKKQSKSHSKTHSKTQSKSKQQSSTDAMTKEVAS
jgi:ribosome maturation factor RimP